MIVLRAEGECQAAKIKADQYAETEMTRSKAEVVASTNKAKALEVEAEAEEKAAQQLKEKRDHDLALRKLEVLRQMALNGKIVISGENGDRFIKELTSSIDC